MNVRGFLVKVFAAQFFLGFLVGVGLPVDNAKLDLTNLLDYSLVNSLILMAGSLLSIFSWYWAVRYLDSKRIDRAAVVISALIIILIVSTGYARPTEEKLIVALGSLLNVFLWLVSFMVLVFSIGLVKDKVGTVAGVNLGAYSLGWVMAMGIMLIKYSLLPHYALVTGIAGVLSALFIAASIITFPVKIIENSYKPIKMIFSELISKKEIYIFILIFFIYYALEGFFKKTPLEFHRQFSYSASEMGIVATVKSIFLVLGIFALGFCINRFKIVRVIAVLSLFLALISFLLSGIETGRVLFYLFPFTGLFYSLRILIIPVVTVLFFKYDNFPRNYFVAGLFFDIIIAVPLLGTGILETLAGYSRLYFSGSILLVAFLPLLYFLREKKNIYENLPDYLKGM